jgi:hypothetical protein
MEIIIEEISRNKKLIARHKFLTNKVTLGRGYTNNIILSDPHICPEHLTIEYEDENWVIRDNHSINGCFLAEGKTNADQHIVHSGDIIRLGKSYIRILFPNHPVAKTVPFSTFENLIDFLSKPAVLTFNLCIFTLIAGLMFYLNQPSEVNVTQVIVRAIGITLLFALWPLLMAIIAHFNKHEARVFTQLAISFAFFNLMWLSDIIESIIAFNTSADWPFSSLIALIQIALAFLMIWLNCYIGFHMSQRKRTLIALSITSLIFGGAYMIEISKQPEFSTLPNYNATILNPLFKFSPSSTVDEFINDTNKLFVNTEEKAQKAQL